MQNKCIKIFKTMLAQKQVISNKSNIWGKKFDLNENE